MADKWPLANSVFSNPANWNGGTLPVDGDVIFLDNRTITLDQDIILPAAEIRGTARSGGTAGGLISITSGSFTVQVLRALGESSFVLNVTSTGTTTFVGVTFEGSTSVNIDTLRISTAGTVVFTNCVALAGVGSGVLSTIAGVTLNGSLSSHATTTSTAPAFQTNAMATLNLTGSVIHGRSAVTANLLIPTGIYTVTNESTVGTTTLSGGKWTINGVSNFSIVRQSPSVFQLPNTFVGTLVNANGVGSVVEYTGDVQQHSAGSVFNVGNANAIVRHTGTLFGPDAVLGQLAVTSSVVSAKTILDRIARNPTSGLMPGLGQNWCLKSDSQILASTESSTVTMVPSGSVGDPPSQANVRSGTVYQFGTLTGTCAVPIPAHTSIGVAVDNTVGTLVAGLSPLQLREALFHADDVGNKLRVSTEGAVGLDSDTRVKLHTDQPDYAPAKPLEVKTQVLDVLTVDTFAELTAPPSATSSLKDKLIYLFMWARNKATETSTQRKLFADNGTTVVSTETVGDDGTTFTKGKAS